MSVLKEKLEKLYKEFHKGKTMVLSSSENNKVTSRMMSIVCINGLFYFQTDKTFRKYHQLIRNPQVALCTENIQIEGVCEEIGHPMDNDLFCDKYRECFRNAFTRYSSLKNERLFVVKPTYVERWIYIDEVPFMEILDIEKQKYELRKYESI